MPVYVFRGRNVRTNESISGERFSNSPQALAAVLRKEQVAPVQIQEKKASTFSFSFKKKVSQTEVAVFTRQFSVMLDAGLPLIQGLDAIAQQHPNPAFKDVLEQIRTDVESGSTLSSAMARHPKVFDSLYTNMVAAGETGGILDTILQRLSAFIEKIVKLKRALRSAMIYPATILTVAVGVVAIILWKVIPVFATLFEGFNVELPLLTRAVIMASRIIGNYMIFFIILVVVGVVALKAYYKTDKGRHVVDGALLKSPVLGPILRKIAVARFTRTLATLLTSGVPILEGLNITAKTSGNAVLEDVIYELRQKIEGGGTMADTSPPNRAISRMSLARSCAESGRRAFVLSLCGSSAAASTIVVGWLSKQLPARRALLRIMNTGACASSIPPDAPLASGTPRRVCPAP